MTSVTGKGTCPNCGSNEATTFVESASGPSLKQGVYSEAHEHLLSCADCGYHEESKDELHEDGKWYTCETVLRPQVDRPHEDIEALRSASPVVSEYKEHLSHIRKDGTVIPIDPETLTPLYTQGEDGVLIPNPSKEEVPS